MMEDAHGAETIAQRKLNNVCIECGKTGHFLRDCADHQKRVADWRKN